MVFRTLLTFMLSWAVLHPAAAQDPKLELRGAWIATVRGLDWPSSPYSSSHTQIQQLETLFDGLETLGINTVFFQVRSEADAMFDSPYEPWSVHLTGQQGMAPDPLYDPLEVAVDLAHEHGMELHAWINPFRAVSTKGSYSVDPTHVTVQHPEWMLEVGDQILIDPGIPEARAYVVEVVADIVRRYEVAGIHFDDYFYPYSPQVGTHDQQTYDVYGGGFPNRADWRRDNINQFVRDTYAAVLDADPDAMFGISPFGIWRDGVPAGISGLDAYSVIYADATAWLEAGTVDYLVPQLYWTFGGQQDFAVLSEWWADVSNGRPVYTGHAAYRADFNFYPPGGTPAPFPASEIPAQVRHARGVSGVEGSVFFRTQNLLSASSQGLADSLITNLYPSLALRPPLAHRDVFPPSPPENLTATPEGSGVSLRWDPPLFGPPYANRFAVYRVAGDRPSDLREVTNDARHLIAVSFDPDYVDVGVRPGENYHYVVTGLSPNAIESDESNLASVGVTTGTGRPDDISTLSLDVWPNPARAEVNISFSSSGTRRGLVRVFDLLGRMVGRFSIAEKDVVNWDLTDGTGRPLASGVYLVIASSGSGATTKSLVVFK